MDYINLLGKFKQLKDRKRIRKSLNSDDFIEGSQKIEEQMQTKKKTHLKDDKFEDILKKFKE